MGGEFRVVAVANGFVRSGQGAPSLSTSRVAPSVVERRTRRKSPGKVLPRLTGRVTDDSVKSAPVTENCAPDHSVSIDSLGGTGGNRVVRPSDETWCPGRNRS